MKKKFASQPVRRSPWPAVAIMRRRLREGGFFKLRVLIGVLLCFAAITVVLFALGKASAQPRTPLASPPKANKIAPWVMEHTANGQEAEFFVMLADQADLSGADSLPAKVEKGRFVYETLLSKAQTTQEPILQLLRDSGIEHQSFYIVNAILVKGTREVAEMLAARADVASVDGNPTIHNDLPQPGPVEMSSGPRTPATIEPGIVYTHAPLVWALGYIGQNIVIASADTGVRWTHNALKPHYRGWDGVNANHNLNWHDSIHDSVGNPCGNDTQAPCDDFFHGSHTTGTAIGDDGMGNQIGMAPGAKWIGCRNMDVGNGTPARYIECMQWFLAPYPLNCTPAQGDPTKAPDITINSWGCPASEGCTTGDELRVAVEAQAAAGIQMVVAAGNSGPGCSTVSDPPSFYAASYTAGALTTGTDTIAGFSSRGPVTRDGSNRTKPDITAPGTSTRSACNSSDTCYTFASGTSMATPHIAGAMGLLWCARPSLRHLIQASRDALDNAAFFISSTFCGTAGPPNNVYGWGRVDISAAVGMPSPTATPSPTPSPTASPVACLQGSATPTPTVTATPTATRTPTATPIVTATPTATRTPTPTPTVVATATPTATCAASYTTTTGTGTITAGGTDIGNHCDDCDTLVNLPFPVSVYGTPISVAYAGSNGTLQFVAVPQPKPFYFMQCIPVNPTQGGPFLNTLFPYYDDQRTDVNPLQTCADCGIFTQTLGTAPNRQFVIRWKTTYFNFAGTAEYEVLLTEGSNTLSVIYGATANNGLTAASGIQQNLTQFTSFSCMTATLTSGLRVNYIPTSCGASPTPTPTPTATRTPTPTATPTPTSTPQQRATPTARPQLTPAPRP